MVENTRIVSEANVAHVAEKIGILRELKWIESTGTQYIDTGYKPNGKTKIDITYWTNDASSSAICATDTDWNNPAGFGIWANAYKFGSHKGVYSDDGGVANWNYLYKISEIMDENGIVKNGHTHSSSIAPESFIAEYNLTLFALNRSGSMQEYTHAKMYGCKIYDDGILVRDFVPCIWNNVDACLYDLVEKKLYKNQGTGNFIAGPDAKIPDKYQELEYIENDPVNGNTGPYINTQVIPNGSAKVWADFQYEGIPDNTAGCLFGARNQVSSAYSNMFGFLFRSGNGTDHEYGYFRFDYNSANVQDRAENLDKTRHQITIDSAELRYEDSRGLVSTPSNFSCSYPMTIFAYNTNNSTFGNEPKAKLYGFEYYDNNVNRFYIPCKELSTGLCGLYELFEKKFYSNSGDASLNSNILDGPEATTERLDVSVSSQRPATMKLVSKLLGIPSNGTLDNRPVSIGLLKFVCDRIFDYKLLDYIQSSGAQYVNTGVIPSSNTRVVAKFAFPQDTGNTAFPTVFGSWDGTYANAFIYLALTDISQGGYSYYGSSYFVDGFNYKKDTVYTIDANKNVFAISDFGDVTLSAQTFSGHYPMFLFAYNSAGIPLNLGNMRIYSVDIYENDDILRKLIPAKRKSDNAVGMYDNVHQVFYENQGTGTFIAGPEL